MAHEWLLERVLSTRIAHGDLHVEASKRVLSGTVTVVLGALAVAGCEHHPTVPTTSAVAGRLASYCAIPPEAIGFADIGPTGDEDELRAIHVAMVVANNADTTWKIVTCEQMLASPAPTRDPGSLIDPGWPSACLQPAATPSCRWVA